MLVPRSEGTHVTGWRVVDMRASGISEGGSGFDAPFVRAHHRSALGQSTSLAPAPGQPERDSCVFSEDLPEEVH